jgi:hypothetical protein
MFCCEFRHGAGIFLKREVLEERNLSVTERNATLGKVIGGEFESDFISRQDSDAIPPEAPRQVGQDHPVMFKLNTEQSAGEFLQHCAGDLDAILFAHIPPEWNLTSRASPAPEN